MSLFRYWPIAGMAYNSWQMTVPYISEDVCERTASLQVMSLELLGISVIVSLKVCSTSQVWLLWPIEVVGCSYRFLTISGLTAHGISSLEQFYSCKCFFFVSSLCEASDTKTSRTWAVGGRNLWLLGALLVCYVAVSKPVLFRSCCLSPDLPKQMLGVMIWSVIAFTLFQFIPNAAGTYASVF